MTVVAYVAMCVNDVLITYCKNNDQYKKKKNVAKLNKTSLQAGYKAASIS